MAILVGIFGGCTDLSQALSDGGGWDGIGDLSTADAATRCPGVPCPGGMLCHLGLCIPDQGSCQDDDHCINDSYCEKGRCLPYGIKTKTSNPGCLLPLQPFKADQLEQPLQEPPNWKSYNNYRQNVQGLGLAKTIPRPDLTGAAVAQVEPGFACDKRWDLRAKICTRGAARALSGVYGTFYLGDPRKGGKPICSAAPTATELKPGECVAVSCAYLNPPATKIDLWFHADKDSTGAGSTAECKEQNNLLHLPRSSCIGVS